MCIAVFRSVDQRDVNEGKDGKWNECSQPLHRPVRPSELRSRVVAVSAVFEHRMHHDRKYHHKEGAKNDHKAVMHPQSVSPVIQ